MRLRRGFCTTLRVLLGDNQQPELEVCMVSTYGCPKPHWKIKRCNGMGFQKNTSPSVSQLGRSYTIGKNGS